MSVENKNNQQAKKQDQKNTDIPQKPRDPNGNTFERNPNLNPDQEEQNKAPDILNQNQKPQSKL